MTETPVEPTADEPTPPIENSFDRPLQPGYALGDMSDPAPANRYPNITAARYQSEIANTRAGFHRSAGAVERQYAALTGTSQPAP